MLMRSVAARFAAFASALLLSACAEFTLPELPSLPFGPTTTEEMSLLGGEVQVRGPSGYCIDARSSRALDGFALMAQCAVLGGEGNVSANPALVSLQVGTEGSAIVEAETDALVTLLSSKDGSAFLSETEQQSDVAVRATDKAVIVSYDTSDGIEQGLQAMTSRALFDLSGRLATLTVRGSAEAPISRDAAERLLLDALEALRSVNAVVQDNAT